MKPMMMHSAEELASLKWQIGYFDGIGDVCHAYIAGRMALCDPRVTANDIGPDDADVQRGRRDAYASLAGEPFPGERRLHPATTETDN